MNGMGTEVGRKIYICIYICIYNFCFPITLEQNITMKWSIWILFFPYIQKTKPTQGKLTDIQQKNLKGQMTREKKNTK